MPPLFLQSALMGGRVSPLWVFLLSLVTRARQLSPSLDSLIPSRMAYLITKYSSHIATAKPMASSTMSWKAAFVISIWNVCRLPMSLILSSRIGTGSKPAPVRPLASQESAPRPLRAPRAVKAQGATRKRSRNRLEWLQIALALEDMRGCK